MFQFVLLIVIAVTVIVILIYYLLAINSDVVAIRTERRNISVRLALQYRHADCVHNILTSVECTVFCLELAEIRFFITTTDILNDYNVHYNASPLWSKK